MDLTPSFHPLLERRWEHDVPETDAVYRYAETVHLTDRDSVAISRTLAGQSHHGTAVRAETQEHRTAKREASGIRWRGLWWGLGAAALCWLIGKSYRLWPFYRLRIRGK